MYVGNCGDGQTEELFAHPMHPYTEALMSAVPKPDPRAAKNRIVLEGDVADPANPPSGCYFHPRCRYAVDQCKIEEPTLDEITPGHYAKCWRARELALRGVGQL
jgi:peptide/nickel transport system ATP-binding protein